MSDPFRLERFLKAQSETYDDALDEIRGGRKRSHWMWFIFPQFAGLGSSPISAQYAIKSIDEAKAYLAHPILGQRLRECAQAVLDLEGSSATAIFGGVDAMKLRSSATLFAAVSQPGSVFHRIIDAYFDGREDERTRALMR